MAGFPDGAVSWLKSTVAGWLQALRRRGLLTTVAFVVPISSMCVVLTTVATCLCIWRSSPSYLPGVLFPAVSELGVEMPQKRLYQFGFGIGGALLSMGILLFELLAAPHFLAALGPPPAVAQDVVQKGSIVVVSGLKAASHLNGKLGRVVGAADESGEENKENTRWQVQFGPKDLKAIRPENLAVAPTGQTGGGEVADQLGRMIWWGQASAVGVIVQGVFTLEREVSMQCVVHWLAAMVFMMGAMNHARASNEMFERAREYCGADGASGPLRQLLAGRGVSTSMWLRRIILDYSSVAMFAVPLIMQVMPRASTPAGDGDAAAAAADQAKSPMDPATMNTMGLMQWGIILQFAIYFCTYTSDICAAATLDVEADKGKKDDS